MPVEDNIKQNSTKTSNIAAKEYGGGGDYSEYSKLLQQKQ